MVSLSGVATRLQANEWGESGRVDCIFIDPPYNTGNEGWCYSDNVNAPMIREWLDANPVGVEDGLRHYNMVRHDVAAAANSL